MMRSQPDFIYVGLKRSASSFLRGYFNCHPDIVWQRKPVPELYDALFRGSRFETGCEVPNGARFITGSEFLATGPIFDSDRFWEENRLRPGLSCAAAGCRLNPAEIAQGLKRVWPAAKIIIVLRSQIDWFRTHYRVFISNLPAGQHRFRDFLTTPEGQVLLNGGSYHRTLKAYFDLFGRENVDVALFEDVRDNETGMLRALCAFLGVREVPYDPQYRRYNRGPSNAEVNVKSWLAAVGISPRTLAPLRPLVRAIRARLPAKLSAADPIPAEDCRMLGATYAESNRETARLIGRDLQAAGYPW